MMWLGLLFGLTIYGIGCGFLGAHVATVKGRAPEEGFCFGLLMGPIGVLIEALLPTLEVRPVEAEAEVEADGEPATRWSPISPL